MDDLELSIRADASKSRASTAQALATLGVAAGTAGAALRGFPSHPAMRAAANEHMWREEQLVICRALGATAEELQRHEAVVIQLAQSSIFENGVVWREGWGLARRRLMTAKPVTPADTDDWADELFRAAFQPQTDEEWMRGTMGYVSWMATARVLWADAALAALGALVHTTTEDTR